MRIWLSPDKLADYNLTPQDVIAAVQEQNSQFAAGQFGQQPMANISLIPTASTPRAVWSMPRSSAISFLKPTTTAAPCFV